jgi:GxxExxY protein
LESAYIIALVTELRSRGISVRVQVPIEMEYKGALLGKVYVMDILVEDEIILEIKSVDAIQPVYKAQLILINFNVPLLKEGFHRIVLNF